MRTIRHTREPQHQRNWRIYRYVAEKAVRLCPVRGKATWREQNRRGRKFPFVAKRIVHFLVRQIDELLQDKILMRDKIIELQKELSALKRKKKE